MILILSLIFVSSVLGQTCMKERGPCLNEQCPTPGDVCTKTSLCCAETDLVPELMPQPGPLLPQPEPVVPPVVVPVPVAPVPVAPVIPSVVTCLDNSKINCANFKKFCEHSKYNELLTKNCPSTCNKCSGASVVPAPVVTSGSSSSSNCQDKSNPRTRQSNCAGLVKFCSNTLYKNVMTEQCPKTCGFCT